MSVVKVYHVCILTWLNLQVIEYIVEPAMYGPFILILPSFEDIVY
jgi:hypothetical protein